MNSDNLQENIKPTITPAEDEEYTVEAIVAWRYSIEHRCKEFFVKWLHYDMDDCTWEPESNLNCPDLLVMFKRTLSEEDRNCFESQDPEQLNGLQRHASLRDVLSIEQVYVDGEPHTFCICRFCDSHVMEQITIEDLIKYRPVEALRFLGRRLIYDYALNGLNYLPGFASLLEQIDKRVLVLLRDGRTLFGILRSIDQFANLVLHLTVERIYSGKNYGEIDRGVFLIRGENVVLCGELNENTHGVHPGYTKVPIEVILADQSEEAKEKSNRDKLKQKALKERGLLLQADGLGDEM